ncbi:ectomycorrhiza-regulated protein [Mycena maculata]|uniref:Ectomycorrhiza-regulated protein n=1 Tax=Mycena maculata TaxID=230809 RepID=A0AAD7HK53_9AGAR|nr:ectomycorrhiza-regulated protein [Mycena maculata]
MSNMYTYPQHPQQLDYSMQNVNAGYYTQPNQSGHYSAGNSPSSPSHPLSMVGPTRNHPSIGIRKRYPDGMPVPISDAPTQPRTYTTPSLTSKKEIPAFFATRRSLSQPSDEEEDELTEEPLSANATDQEKIEYKRRQNTLAARRSRKRKLMHQQQLEEAVERLTHERDVWKTRALMLSKMLQSHGITCPNFD